MNKSTLFFGIDISKDSFDVYGNALGHKSYPNTRLGFKSFVKDARPQLDLDKVATGEHWYGTQALDLDLIDEIITSDDYLLSKFDTHDIFELSYIKESKGVFQKLSAQIASKIESVFFGRFL